MSEYFDEGDLEETLEEAIMSEQKQVTASRLALLFHEAYERLAPEFGYETRTETRSFDVESPNGKLMVAVCQEILLGFRATPENPLHESPTFATKLDQMRLDLCSIVDRMNRDQNTEVAMVAQQTLVALVALREQVDRYGLDEFDWDWEPHDEVAAKP